jgi:hypothetical protein
MEGGQRGQLLADRPDRRVRRPNSALQPSSTSLTSSSSSTSVPGVSSKRGVYE